jgi:histidinol-phosphatase (PHP family)
MKMLHNYHTHTKYCKHAENSVEEMVLKAIDIGLKTIGFSEHIPWQSNNEKRMSIEDLPNFIKDVEECKVKYSSKIKVLCGLESEYNIHEDDYFQSLKNTPGIQYLILGNHNKGKTEDNLLFSDSKDVYEDSRIYVQQIRQAAESNLFLYIAHPDIFLIPWKGKYDEYCEKMILEIFTICKQYNLPLGFNVNGVVNKSNGFKFYYPFEYFWKMVKDHSVPIVLEIDAHSIKDMEMNIIEDAESILQQWELESLLIKEFLI